MEQRDCRLRASSAPGRSPAALSLVAHFPKLRARTESWPVIAEKITPNQRLLVQRWQLLPAVCPRSPGEAPAGICEPNLRRSPHWGPSLPCSVAKTTRESQTNTVAPRSGYQRMHESAKNAMEARQKFSRGHMERRDDPVGAP